MAETDLTPEELNAIDVLPKFNERPQQKDPAAPAFNPYGFDNNGYLDNQMLQGRMTAIMGVLARRMALSASASALLAHEDAENTKLDRIAAAQSATAAAGSAGNAKTDADRARDYAAGVKMPAINATVAGYFLRVNAAGAAFETSRLDFSSHAQAEAGTDTTTVMNPLRVRQNVEAAPGTIKTGSIIYAPSSPGAGFLPCDGAIYLKSAYPALAAKLGTPPDLFGGEFVSTLSSFGLFDYPMFARKVAAYYFVFRSASTTRELYVAPSKSGPYAPVSNTALNAANGTYQAVAASPNLYMAAHTTGSSSDYAIALRTVPADGTTTATSRIILSSATSVDRVAALEWLNGTTWLAVITDAASNGTNNRLFLSNNDGASWTPLGSLNMPTVRGSAVTADAVFLFAVGGEIWKSPKAGISPATFTRKRAATGAANTAMAVLGSKIFASTGDPAQYIRSNDNGETWTSWNVPKSLGLGNNINSLSAWNNHLYLGTPDSRYAYSSDGDRFVVKRVCGERAAGHILPVAMQAGILFGTGAGSNLSFFTDFAEFSFNPASEFAVPAVPSDGALNAYIRT